MSNDTPKNVSTVWSLVVAGTCGFLATAWAVSAGVTADIDRRLLLMLRDPHDLSDAWGPAWFEETAAEVTALGGYTILSTVTLVVLVTLWLLHKRQAAIFTLAAVASGTAVSTVMKQVFSRPRPDLVDHMDRVFTSSFPSGHAMVSMVAWLTLAAIAIRFIPRHALRIFMIVAAFALSILIGFSRIYLGVHWPSDVVAGWCLGASWAGACWLAAHYLARKPDQVGDLGHSKA